MRLSVAEQNAFLAAQQELLDSEEQLMGSDTDPSGMMPPWAEMVYRVSLLTSFV
jgi:hypothetical protein